MLKEKEPIPSIESIIHSLQEEENKHNHTHNTNEVPNSQALFVSSSKTYKPCKHCGKTNHVSLNCYKIKKCVKCGKIGHSPQFCPKGSSDCGSSRSDGGGTSSKGRHVHYTHDEDSDRDGDGDHTKLNTNLHFILATSFSNEVHAKNSPKIGKKYILFK